MQRSLMEVRDTAGNIDACDKCYVPKALLPRTNSRDTDPLCVDKTNASTTVNLFLVGLRDVTDQYKVNHDAW
jgi:hypothetical protein